MEHPLIGSIASLTIEEVQDKITDLHKKLGIAQRSGNGHLCHQLRMALETFQNRYQQILDQSKKSGETDFSNKIKIE